jgi:hypothetical protein
MSEIECRAISVTDEDIREQLERYREKLVRDAFWSTQPVRTLFPTTVWGALTLHEPDPRLVKLVERTFEDEKKRSVRDVAGYIYVFRDRRDPSLVVKIGRTERRPRDRIVEWQRELDDRTRDQVLLLFSRPTRYNRLAESVIHKTLLCEWVPRRVDERGRQLVEYFRIANILALKALLIYATVYCDAFGDELPFNE